MTDAEVFLYLGIVTNMIESANEKFIKDHPDQEMVANKMAEALHIAQLHYGSSSIEQINKSFNTLQEEIKKKIGTDELITKPESEVTQ